MMNAQNFDELDNNEKPLDPATEKVRRKLARYGAVFMGFNILALMAVLGAIVYKIGGYGDKNKSGTPSQSNSVAPVEFDRNLDLPQGASVVNASQNGNQILLNLVFQNGDAAIWIYDIALERITGKLAIK